MKFGIMGYGRFGKLWAAQLAAFGEVFVYDHKPMTLADETERIKISNLKQVAQADLVFILTPISIFEESCVEIKPYLPAATIVADCCSVKMYSAMVMQKIFNKQQTLIATHPLFGPDSVKKTGGLSGHKIAVCPLQGAEEALAAVTDLLIKMGLSVFTTSVEEHDRQMAKSQALVHFIGRGLAGLNLQTQALATPDFQTLLNINHMVINDSKQLFLDMQTYNPYMKEIRQKLIAELTKLNKEVNEWQP